MGFVFGVGLWLFVVVFFGFYVRVHLLSLCLPVRIVWCVVCGCVCLDCLLGFDLCFGSWLCLGFAWWVGCFLFSVFAVLYCRFEACCIVWLSGLFFYLNTCWWVVPLFACWVALINGSVLFVVLV